MQITLHDDADLYELRMAVDANAIGLGLLDLNTLFEQKQLFRGIIADVGQFGNGGIGSARFKSVSAWRRMIENLHNNNAG